MVRVKGKTIATQMYKGSIYWVQPKRILCLRMCHIDHNTSEIVLHDQGISYTETELPKIIKLNGMSKRVMVIPGKFRNKNSPLLKD